MKFQSPSEFNLIPENEYSSAMPKVESLLAEVKIGGVFASFDGTMINYEYFLCENAKASVVVVHGYTEFIEKFYEVAYYFLCEGYNVFLYDQRGHGRSERAVMPYTLTHVEKFSDYVDDLSEYIEKIVVPASEGKKLYLFGHSMGGTVSAFYLMRGGERIEKAVLSSPMICPYSAHFPRKLLKFIIKKQYSKKLGWKAKFPHTGGDFDENPDFSKSSDTSYPRFLRNLEIRKSDKRYRNTSSTNRWMYEVLSVREKLLVKSEAGKVKASVLLVSAENDTVVKNKDEFKFASLLPKCETYVALGSKHTVFTGEYPIQKAYYEKVFAFLK